MTRVILNLGLDGPTYGKVDTMTRDERARAYLARLKYTMQHGMQVSRHRDTLIVEGDLQFRIGVVHLSQLAECAEQDCIAAWFPDLGIGELYGPGSGLWGAFDKQYFKMPVERRGDL
jgi:hypothetical protein